MGGGGGGGAGRFFEKNNQDSDKDKQNRQANKKIIQDGVKKTGKKMSKDKWAKIDI